MNRIELTYVGRVISKKGKLVYKYLYNDGIDQMLFPFQIKTCAIGTIIEATQTETGVATPYEFIGKVEEADKLNIWTQKDKANKREIDITRKFTKVRQTQYDSIVKELNNILINIPTRQRLLFKMKLINDLK